MGLPLSSTDRVKQHTFGVTLNRSENGNHAESENIDFGDDYNVSGVSLNPINVFSHQPVFGLAFDPPPVTVFDEFLWLQGPLNLHYLTFAT